MMVTVQSGPILHISVAGLSLGIGVICKESTDDGHCTILTYSRILTLHISVAGLCIGIGVVCKETTDGHKGIFIEDIKSGSIAHQDGRIR
jgi:hypothetical protein